MWKVDGLQSLPDSDHNLSFPALSPPTDEKTTTPDGPRFPHLVPFPNPNKVKALQLRNYGDIARNVQPPPVALPPQKIKLKLPSMASLQSPPSKASPPQ